MKFDCFSRSRGFREFKTKKTRKALWEAKTASDSKSSRGEETPPPSTSPEIVLALCFLTLDDDEDREQALHLLLRLPASQQVSLAAALIEHHHLLFEKRQESAPEVTGFSDLAVLFQDCVPEMFVEVRQIQRFNFLKRKKYFHHFQVLVSLVLGGAIGLKSVLSLFLSALASASSAVDASHERINSATAALQLFLETYFTEVLADSEQHQQQQGEDDPCDGEILEAAQTEEGEEALQTLVRSYLASLSVPVHFGEKNIDADMFGNRLLCLDKLPPFQESAKEVLDASSPEFWCQNSLLKLQSLLSCPQLATAPVKDTVLHFLDNVGFRTGMFHSDNIKCSCYRLVLLLLLPPWLVSCPFGCSAAAPTRKWSPSCAPRRTRPSSSASPRRSRSLSVRTTGGWPSTACRTALPGPTTTTRCTRHGTRRSRSFWTTWHRSCRLSSSSGSCRGRERTRNSK